MAFKHILLLIATLYVLNEACKGDSTGIEIPLLRGESTARLVHGGHGLGTKPYTSRDDPIGGGISVLGTYYVQVLANGHPLRLLVVCARLCWRACVFQTQSVQQRGRGGCKKDQAAWWTCTAKRR